MNANGQRFWLLADREHWTEAPHLRYDGERRSLRLASERAAPAWAVGRVDAQARLEQVPEARDRYGTRARWSAARRRLVATGALPGEVPILKLRRGMDPTDLALGFDGVLYVAAGGEVLLHDRRGRRADAQVRATGFQAWRLAPDPAGGAWALDRVTRRLARTVGQLWPDLPFQARDPEVFRPDPENPRPPELRVLDVTWPAEETTAAVACSPGGRLAVLTWDAGGEALLRVLRPDGISPPLRLSGARLPFSLAWASEERVALLLAGVGEAAVYEVPPDDALAERVEGERVALPVGDVYPLRGHDGGPFVHGVDLPPHYPTLQGSRALHRLSLPAFAAAGEAMNQVLLDAGDAGTVWHRLYVEASIPPRCSIVLRLAATELPAAPVEAEDWYEHRFGDAPGAADDGVPRGAWVPEASELPFHPGMLRCAGEPGRAGLFTVLVQRAGRRVRALAGRYLWVRAELRGDGLASPELAAVRAYAGRFSYRDRYLPELYRETVFGAEADAAVLRSTPADFLERFLGNFEGVLTTLEDRVAASYLLTDPRSVPAESLEWLAGWIGFSFDAAVPEERRRAMLAAAPELARLRGTPRGLALALELATGGGVSGGEIVVLEDYRLRRTFATILGADLADEDDPLLCGLSVSGNSYVGDTLFLCDERRREFLALFSAGLPLTAAEERAVEAFFEKLAHRVTVLVHQEVEPQELGLIRRVVEREVPAHVESRVLAASLPLVVGVASLVGVDTYLGKKPGITPVRVNRSRVGVRDFVVAPVSLDPRLEGGDPGVGSPPPDPPVARLTRDEMEVPGTAPFELDGTPSEADEGQWIDRYRWMRRPE